MWDMLTSSSARYYECGWCRNFDNFVISLVFIRPPREVGGVLLKEAPYLNAQEIWFMYSSYLSSIGFLFLKGKIFIVNVVWPHFPLNPLQQIPLFQVCRGAFWWPSIVFWTSRNPTVLSPCLVIDYGVCCYPINHPMQCSVAYWKKILLWDHHRSLFSAFQVGDAKNTSVLPWLQSCSFLNLLASKGASLQTSCSFPTSHYPH